MASDTVSLVHGYFLTLSYQNEWILYSYEINQGTLTYKQESGSEVKYVIELRGHFFHAETVRLSSLLPADTKGEVKRALDEAVGALSAVLSVETISLETVADSSDHANSAYEKEGQATSAQGCEVRHHRQLLCVFPPTDLIGSLAKTWQSANTIATTDDSPISLPPLPLCLDEISVDSISSHLALKFLKALRRQCPHSDIQPLLDQLNECRGSLQRHCEKHFVEKATQDSPRLRAGSLASMKVGETDRSFNSLRRGIPLPKTYTLISIAWASWTVYLSFHPSFLHLILFTMVTCGLIQLYRHYTAGGTREQAVAALVAYLARVRASAAALLRTGLQACRLIALYILTRRTRRNQAADLSSQLASNKKNN